MQEADLQLEKKLNIGAIIVSIAVLGLVALMRKVKLDIGVDLSFLPAVHALLNSLSAVALIYSLAAIKNGKIAQHRAANFTALALSTLFLLCYVAYHFTTPETIFGDVNHDKILDEAEKAALGGTRTAYLILLLTHIAAAAIIFPFILFTFIRAITNQIEKHRKMARWVYWIWLYVAITGPVCYFMLKPYY
jgi:putative membrane protein